MYVASTLSGSLEIYSNKVVIKNLLDRTIEIYIEDIGSIEFSGGNLLIPGFIQIKSKSTTGLGLKGLLLSQQKVVFAGNHKKKFQKAKNLIEELVSKKINVVSNHPPITEEIERIADLHASGTLTDTEFEELKRRLIQGK